MKEIAKRGRDALSGPLRLGVKYTIGPYRLPDLVRQVIEHVPQMPLLLQENFIAKLPQMLRTGELDCAIMAEPFPAAVPRRHPLARRKSISTDGLKSETLLRPGAGHCFRAPQVRAPRGDRGAAQCDLRVPAGRHEALVVMRRSKVRLVVAPVTHTRSITWNSPASATPA